MANPRKKKKFDEMDAIELKPLTGREDAGDDERMRTPERPGREMEAEKPIGRAAKYLSITKPVTAQPKALDPCDERELRESPRKEGKLIATEGVEIVLLDRPPPLEERVELLEERGMETEVEAVEQKKGSSSNEEKIVKNEHTPHTSLDKVSTNQSSTNAIAPQNSTVDIKVPISTTSKTSRAHTPLQKEGSEKGATATGSEPVPTATISTGRNSEMNSSVNGTAAGATHDNKSETAL
eukprot:CAMPEP_0184504052 /NCGR_PEP_ID=MMETSP0113_2-20130426/52256_1 /TAXON_ID=91329 /ORGANISM="Norrisiella sphaerica, Strain BC52" /LENGTH=237 /DNA_ID=CAMNT_0026893663 /DNA_START=1604 /DNA_END=2317 /DNA_ORIENTATION=-